MPHLAFCANCGSERLDLFSGGPSGLSVRCYVGTQTSAVSGVTLGEIDFLAGAQARVDAMITKAKERETGLGGQPESDSMDSKWLARAMNHS